MSDANKQGEANEGEGSKTADKSYREAATEFAKSNDTAAQGLKAEREVEAYRDEYEKAEKEGRSHSAGEDPKDLDPKNWVKKP